MFNDNMRANKLFDDLKKFAIENNRVKLDFLDYEQEKWFIIYDNFWNEIFCDKMFKNRFVYQGVVYFDSEELANQAINTFFGELKWYYTEYKGGYIC